MHWYFIGIFAGILSQTSVTNRRAAKRPRRLKPNPIYKHCRSCLDEVSAHTPAPACTPRCFGYRNHTPESPALPMQSPAVSRSRHLTVCGGVSVLSDVCASAIVPDIRCFGYRNLTLETSSPSSQSSAVASPGPAKCCARSTSPLCHAVI